MLNIFKKKKNKKIDEDKKLELKIANYIKKHGITREELERPISMLLRVENIKEFIKGLSFIDFVSLNSLQLEIILQELNKYQNLNEKKRKSISTLLLILFACAIIATVTVYGIVVFMSPLTIKGLFTFFGLSSVLVHSSLSIFSSIFDLDEQANDLKVWTDKLNLLLDERAQARELTEKKEPAKANKKDLGINPVLVRAFEDYNANIGTTENKIEALKILTDKVKSNIEPDMNIYGSYVGMRFAECFWQTMRVSNINERFALAQSVDYNFIGMLVFLGEEYIKESNNHIFDIVLNSYRQSDKNPRSYLVLLANCLDEEQRKNNLQK